VALKGPLDRQIRWVCKDFDTFGGVWRCCILGGCEWWWEMEWWRRLVMSWCLNEGCCFASYPRWVAVRGELEHACVSTDLFEQLSTVIVCFRLWIPADGGESGCYGNAVSGVEVVQIYIPWNSFNACKGAAGAATWPE
jgi:hypothetical protein